MVKLDYRAEAEPKTTLTKYHQSLHGLLPASVRHPGRATDSTWRREFLVPLPLYHP